jgi:hypothetical protein
MKLADFYAANDMKRPVPYPADSATLYSFRCVPFLTSDKWIWVVPLHTASGGVVTLGVLLDGTILPSISSDKRTSNYRLERP